jgi:thiamine biosynthesis lipoprotein ApbE
VAVVTETGTLGDALDDAFFVLGVPGTREYLRRLAPTEVFFFEPKGGGSRCLHLVN